MQTVRPGLILDIAVKLIFIYTAPEDIEDILL